MSNDKRIHLVKHLLEVTKDKPVERQLREQWLAELARYKLIKQDSKDAVNEQRIVPGSREPASFL